LIPNSPYFIGLFLCQDEQVNFPYKGRYFHTGGRFVCLGKPAPDAMTVSEFDLDRGFKSYFSKGETPGISGIGFGVDTSKAGGDGKAAAFIRRIEFFEKPMSGSASSSGYYCAKVDAGLWCDRRELAIHRPLPRDLNIEWRQTRTDFHIYDSEAERQ
jgi:hypothetical protein